MGSTIKPPSAYFETRAKAQRLHAEKLYEPAAQAYASAATLWPTSNAGLFAAICLKDAGQLQKATEAFQRYTTSCPNDPHGWTALGMLEKSQGLFANAVISLRKSLKIQHDITVRNALVSALWQTKNLEEAISEADFNLRAKHHLAFESFLNSPYRDHRLGTIRRKFDPSRRDRNIISFSLWGDRPEYVTGAIVNAQIAQHIYVGWTPRFYCDHSVPADAIEALKVYGAQVVMMDKAFDAKIRPMWRFLVCDDPNVDFFVCRDTDSRLNAKELLAVQDWLDSGKRFHVMRDHVFHHELVLAGMWGGTAGVLPNIRTWLNNAPQYFDNRFGDQAFLAEMIWPLVIDDVQVHDSYFRYPVGAPFPKGYDLPGLIHVGGAVKSMPHWSKYVQMPGTSTAGDPR